MKTLTYALMMMAAFASADASAKCFKFTDEKPTSIADMSFGGYAADRVCVYKINGFSGTHYSVRFSDAEGDIAALASQTEEVARCPGFCREYDLTSGSILGKNVNPKGVRAKFQVERPTDGKLTFTYGRGVKTYRVAQE